MTNNSVLLVGAGRRYELAKLFILWGYEVHSYEKSRQVPIADIANEVHLGMDFILDKPIDIIKDIARLHSRYNFRFIFPCFDPALSVLLGSNSILPSLVISRWDGVTMACNKSNFNILMEQNFNDYFPKAKLGYPAIAKPVKGFGSKGTFIIQPDLLDIYIQNQLRSYVLQRYITGDEYSVDCYFRPSHDMVDGVVRKRLRVSGGEVISSVTVYDEEMLEVCRNMGKLFGFVGPINIQFIRDLDSKLYCIEVNARFGGGFTFSILSGLSVFSLLEEDYYGKKSFYVPNSWIKNSILERSYRDHFYFGDKK